MADHNKDLAFVRQLRALALNRRNAGTDRDRSIQLMSNLLEEQGPDPETLSILGRAHEDRYKALKDSGNIMATAALDDAIAAYRRGF